jgi:flagellar biosynthesis anti-sigma factor FlgM
MTIHDRDPRPAIPRIANHRGGGPRKPMADPTRESSSAVHVLGTRRRLAAERAPEVLDQARIDHLKALVASGRLQIDAGAIADAMLRDEN